jgi:hypothetical protein
MADSGAVAARPKRPVLVTVVSLLLIVTGAGGLVFHGMQFTRADLVDDVLIAAVSIVAIVAGVFLLRGSNWARWLAMLWIGFHVAISAFDSAQKLAIHIVVFAVFGFVLFRSEAVNYFRAPETR